MKKDLRRSPLEDLQEWLDKEMEVLPMNNPETMAYRKVKEKIGTILQSDEFKLQHKIYTDALNKRIANENLERRIDNLNTEKEANRLNPPPLPRRYR